MPRLFQGICLLIAVLSSLSSVSSNAQNAQPDRILTLYCADIGSANWTPMSPEHHHLFAPEPVKGTASLDGHTVVIDLSRGKAFLDQADPSHPVDDSSIGPLTANATNQAIRIANVVQGKSVRMISVNVNIDRRTGIYVQTNRLLNESGHVATTVQYLRMCGTDQMKF